MILVLRLNDSSYGDYHKIGDVIIGKAMMLTQKFW
jgi:hypothetical protein